MSVGYPPPPPPLPPHTVPGTEEWARHQLQTQFSPDDAKAITDAVATGLVPYVSLWRARTHYARVCHERQWNGHKARLAWAVLEALLKDDIDNDIPF
jgi:hypothetical protein